MKNLILLFCLFLLGTGSVVAQKKKELYCSINFKPESKKKITLFYGDSAAWALHPEVWEQFHKIESIKSDIEAVNYMSGLGWKLVNIIQAVTGGYVYEVRFFLKKDFDE